MPTRSSLAYAVLVFGIAATTAGACQRDRIPRECVVWAEAEGHVRGQVYVEDTKASFTAGLSRQEVAYIDSYGHVMILQGSQAIDAAVLSDGRLTVLYLGDRKFVSDPISHGLVALRDGVVKSEFRYNAACSVPDAAVGAMALFQLVYPAGQSSDSTL